MAQLPDPVPSGANFGVVFGLPPERAIAWFESLGISITWDWRDDERIARQAAFSVAKVTEVQVLAAFKEEVARAISEGITQAAFRKHMTRRLAALGWHGSREVIGPDGTRAVVDVSRADRLNTIFRTNMQSAYMAGRYEAQLANANAAPWWQYIAVMDGRTRPAHAAMNGRIYRYDDPVWKVCYPPCGFNCRCRVRALTSEQMDARGLKPYTGALPEGFPDAGFGHAPDDTAGQAQQLALVAARARARADAVGALRPGAGR